MERGADWEYEAVREQWEALKARRKAVNRLLIGLVTTLTGVLLLLLIGSREVCRFTLGGATKDCTVAIPQSTVVLLGLSGILVLVAGLRLCWNSSRR